MTETKPKAIRCHRCGLCVEDGEVFPPGEFIRDELDARGWTQADLAAILGRAPRDVSDIVSGKRSITADTAQGLAQAFGTTPEFWLNLDALYKVGKLKPPPDVVSRRSRLYSLAPIKDLMRRGWIEPTDNIEVLEAQVVRFFELKSVQDEPEFTGFAARRTTSATTDSTAIMAWLFRARSLARGVAASRFSQASLAKALERLRVMLLNPEDIRHVPKILAEAGIRLVVVEHLPKTRLDGSCFWLDEHSPVIALTLRFDRIDYFWHTLLHEIGHVKNGDGKDEVALDIDLVGRDAEAEGVKPQIEVAADSFAAAFSVEPSELADFIARVRPLYSKKKIEGFAARLQVHPGVVVGQLQHRREISLSTDREMLVNTREFIVGAVLTDGWGYLPTQI